MGSRRTLILVAAIVIGAVAAVLVWSYVGGIQDKAYGNAKKVKVFVVKSTVTKGTYGEEAKARKLIVEDQIPAKFFPPNAVRNLDIDLRDKVAISDIAVNQIVTTDMFADPVTVQTTFASRLEKIRGVDQTAISISVNNVRGVAGLLQPGDYVNVMLVKACPDETGDTGAQPLTEQQQGMPCVGRTKGTMMLNNEARYLYQKVQILAIDQTPVAQPGEVRAAAEGGPAAAAPANRGLITVIVPATSAQYLAAADPADIYLTLVPRDYKPVPQASIDPKKPLPAEDDTALTPYGPAGAGK